MKGLTKSIRDHFLLILLLCVVGAVVVTTLTIYLTPLKHYDMIPPTLNEVDPAAFNAELTADPNDYIFIDVRSPDVYASAHAKGAINIPIENLYDEHFTLPHSGKKIALICTTGRLAAIAYGYLEDWGYTNLIHVQGGLENWTYEGLPVEGSNITNIASSSAAEGDYQ